MTFKLDLDTDSTLQTLDLLPFKHMSNTAEISRLLIYIFKDK